MDWTKAKSILIIALVITNLILIYSFVVQGKDGELDKNQDLVSHLKTKNIFVDFEIPTKINKLPVLTVEHDENDSTKIEKALKNEKPFSKQKMNQESLKSEAMRFIKKCGFYNENVVLDKVTLEGEKGVVTYVNKVDDFYLEDSYMKCTFKGGKIVDFDRYWLEPVDFGYQKQSTISAGAALMEFSNKNKDKTEAGEIFRITDMEIVYWLDIEAFDGETVITDTALPAWKITYNEGKVSHISAFE